MGRYRQGFRAYEIAFWIMEVFLLLLCSVPYLIPLGRPHVEISLDDLVGEHGRFLDIDGGNIHIKGQNPDLFSNMVLTFFRSHRD